MAVTFVEREYIQKRTLLEIEIRQAIGLLSKGNTPDTDEIFNELLKAAEKSC